MSQIIAAITARTGGPALQDTVTHLMKQSMGDYQIVIANVRADDPVLAHFNDPRIQVVEREFRNESQYFQYVITNFEAEYLVIVPEGVHAQPEFLESWIIGFKSDPECVAQYGDYLLVDGDRETRVDPFYFHRDVTERVDLGPVQAFRLQTVHHEGGFDESLNVAHLYDLRLRLQEKGTYQRLDFQPVYRVPKQKKAEESSMGASRLFSPGFGEQGGFSYLFYSAAEQLEFELVFKQFLHRQGAYVHVIPEVVDDGNDFDHDVSVVIPVYNRERFIGRAIESVTQGEFEDFEIIVVDNGSTDHTRDRVREWAERDVRVRLIENDLNVISRSLNLGCRAARGKYIAQLDSDDEYTPETLAMAVDQMDEHPAWGLGISYYDLIDEDGTPLEEFGIIKHLEYDPNNHLRVDGAGALRIWRRAVLEEMGWFNEERFGDFGEDYHMVTQVAEKYGVGRIPYILYHYRRHPDNTDVRRSALLKIRNKTLARWDAIVRRRKMNQSGN